MATKKTLLEITQEILSDMTSDEVNSITDTVEAEEVARIVVATFRNMSDNRNWAHQKTTAQLTGQGDTDKPTHFTVASNIKQIESVRYNKIVDGETRKQYKEIYWKEPDDFLRYVNKRNNDESNIEVVTDTGGIELLIRNDIAPTYYTSFNDDEVVMDSYDEDVDSTLQTSKTQIICYKTPTTSFDDDWTPDLPEEAFSGLIERAKVAAQHKVNDFKDLVAAEESGKQQRWLSRKNWRVNGGLKYPNYGRKGRKWRRDPTFERHN